MGSKVAVPSFKKRRIIAAFLGIVLLFAAGMFTYYSFESSTIHDTAARNLQNIGELKISQVVEWRKERIANARTTFRSAFFTEGAEAWLRNRRDRSLRKKVLQRLELVKNEYDYADVFLVSLDGDSILSLDGEPRKFGPRGKAIIAAAKNAPDIIERDLYRSSVDQQIYYDIIAPLRNERNQTIAMLVFRSKPEAHLFPLIQRWPTPSGSSETVLLRKDGDSILYLNELRFQKHTALELRIPMTQTDLPAVQAAKGVKGIFEGRDYRNVRTLAYLAPVPGTPWLMVSKIDYSEIFAELRYRTVLLSILSGIVFLLLGAIFIAYYRSTQLSVSASELAKEVERRRDLEEAQERIRQSEERLRESRELLAETERSGRIGGWSIDVATMHQTWTDETFTIFEFDLTHGAPEVPEGIDLFAPSSLPMVERAVQRAIEFGEAYDQEWEIITRKGNHRWVHAIAHIEREEEKVRRVYGSIQDITERKQAEKKLRLSEERLRMALEAADLGTWDLDIATGVAIHSKRHDEMFGYSEPQTEWSLEKALRHLLPEDRQIAIDAHARAEAEGGLSFEARVRWPDGSVHWILSQGRTQYDDEGRPLRILGIVGDITERKEMEQMMRDVQRREAIGVLSSGIAHDFNNLLSVMMGNVSLAQRNLSEAHPAQQNLGKALTAMENAAELTRQMLAYSGKGKFQMVKIDLANEIETHVALFNVSIPKNVRLVTHLPSHPVYVDGDPAQMKQVIMNLIINGADAIGEEQGSVTVTLSQQEWSAERLAPFSKITTTDLKEGTYALLEVADTGIGMSAETIAKIFDPFYTTKFIGRGLGLSAVLGIIRGLNGGIAIESEPGGGSTFRVLLPVCDDPQTAPCANDPVEEVGTPQTGTVLVIDDENDVAMMARDILEAAGFSVMIETNPLRGIELFRGKHEEVGLVLLDLTMPEMPGEKVAERLLAIDPDTKIIISSGYSESEVVKRIGSRRIAGVVQKPYHMDGFLSKIRTAMQMQRA